jgi:hypothetical protein
MFAVIEEVPVKKTGYLSGLPLSLADLIEV